MAPTPKPQPGDLIEISRVGYSHWAVYVGDDDVVHFGVPVVDTKEPASKAVSSQTGTGCVTKEKLKYVAGNDKWRVKNSLDGTIKPHPAQVIVKDACAQVGKERQYNLLNSNCEHFATELRYGEAVSHQAQTAEAVAAVAAGAGIFGSLVIGAYALAESALKSSTN